MPKPTRRRPGLSRRTFLSATAATATAGVLGFPAILRGKNLNDKMSLALIGVGGRGGDNLKQMVSENIVAICDVNQKNLANAGESAPDAQPYTDFRKLFDELKDTQFDGVVVSVPEHVHAFVTMQALARKKHVYCEKPLTRDVFECRTVIEAAAKAKVATQMGTQIHATANYRRVVE
jgi:predicted dehydrogenase